MLELVFAVGSLRENSFNRKAMERTASLLSSQVRITYAQYTDLPLLNEDDEPFTPIAVVRERQKLQEAQGLWLFCPEYNHSIPGGLKNYLDWMSRPVRPGNRRSAVSQGMKVAVTSIAGSSAGAHVRAALAQALSVMGAQLVCDEGFTLHDAEAVKQNWRVPIDIARALQQQADVFLGALV